MDGVMPKPWELHPMFVHFPIAFLLAGVAIHLWLFWRNQEKGCEIADRILAAGVVSGWPAAVAGVLAFFTVPAHTGEGHDLMYWYAGLWTAALLIRTGLAAKRWRNRSESATTIQLSAGMMGAMLLTITGYLGGAIVYHRGAGVNPEILAPEVPEGHAHGNQPADGHPD